MDFVGFCILFLCTVDSKLNCRGSLGSLTTPNVAIGMWYRSHVSLYLHIFVIDLSILRNWPDKLLFYFKMPLQLTRPKSGHLRLRSRRLNALGFQFSFIVHYCCFRRFVRCRWDAGVIDWSEIRDSRVLKILRWVMGCHQREDPYWM